MKRTDLLSVMTLEIYPFEKPNCELFGALCLTLYFRPFWTRSETCPLNQWFHTNNHTIY